MIVYEFVGGNIWLFTVEGGMFQMDAGWDSKSYYKTIGVTAISNKLYVYGRDFCGMSFYPFASDGSALPSLLCYPDWSDNSGWIRPEYYLTIQGTAADGLLLSGRSAHGMKLFKV